MLISDEEHIFNIVVQTADLRYSVRSEGLRRLLRERNYEPESCLQLSCDQGDDVNMTLVLSDGTIVTLDYREDPTTRQAVRLSRWSVEDDRDWESRIARDIVLSSDTSEFDDEVRRYWKQNLATDDRSLPPCQ